jgi:Tfp pilus assembly protein PilF
MNATLLQDKLTAIPLIKTADDPGLHEFEQMLLYSMLGKLALHTAISCKDLATREDHVSLDPYLSYEEGLATLREIAQAHQSRYVLTGSATASVDHENRVDSVRLTLRLFDAVENRYAVEETTHLTAFEPDYHVSDRVRPTMKAFTATVDWGVALIVHEILSPDEATEAVTRMSPHPFSRSWEALARLIAADRPGGSTLEKIKAYEDAVRLDPSLEIAYFNLGKLYKSVLNYRQSVLSYRKALEVSHSAGRVKALYATEAGIGCALVGEYEPAIQWWQRATEYEPGYINPYMNIAHHYEEQNSLPQAETYFLRAQQVAPEDARTYYSLARVYSKMGQWEKALSQYRHQLTSDAQDPWCHSNIATCYLQMGDASQALVYFKQTAALDPEGEAGQYARLVLNELSV